LTNNTYSNQNVQNTTQNSVQNKRSNLYSPSRNYSRNRNNYRSRSNPSRQSNTRNIDRSYSRTKNYNDRSNSNIRGKSTTINSSSNTSSITRNGQTHTTGSSNTQRENIDFSQLKNQQARYTRILSSSKTNLLDSGQVSINVGGSSEVKVGSNAVMAFMKTQRQNQTINNGSEILEDIGNNQQNQQLSDYQTSQGYQVDDDSHITRTLPTMQPEEFLENAGSTDYTIVMSILIDESPIEIPIVLEELSFDNVTVEQIQLA
jgi:hypothetical protein